VLRLPRYRYHRPADLSGALALLNELGEAAMPVAGGTDLIPNMKHGLFTPSHLVSIAGLPELRGVQETAGGGLRLGAGESLASLAAHPLVRLRVPALADACGHVAGPQLRNRGTLGGNLCLDTRCTYYNQTEFWRSALGYCLKKDGDTCHVTRVGRKCVAAHSADTPPVLICLDASVELAGHGGARRRVPVADFFIPDGIANTRRRPGELVVAVHVPPATCGGILQSYVKLRQRRAVDFPLLTVAVAGETDAEGRVRWLRGVVTGLGSRPRELTGWSGIAEGRHLDPDVVEQLAERAHAQCHPLENMIVDPDWRRAMVPVQVRRALAGLGAGEPPHPGTGERFSAG
jgi:4-hydroxybenzoyl-CoA reductase subunit beta